MRAVTRRRLGDQGYVATELAIVLLLAVALVGIAILLVFGDQITPGSVAVYAAVQPGDRTAGPTTNVEGPRPWGAGLALGTI